MIKRVDFHGLEAIEFSKGDYTALLIPSVGANLVRLANTRLNIEILRTPTAEQIEEFKTRPQIFGLPLLFPPNRIEDGRFTFEGRKYQYPITIEKENNYHHGLINSEQFVFSKSVEKEDIIEIETRYYANPANDAIYKDYPHAFKCKMVFKLSNKGLEHEVMIQNKSDQTMPIGIGYHTPINLPFHAGDNSADYKLTMSVDAQWQLSERNLPQGLLPEMESRFEGINTTGIKPVGTGAIEAAFRNKSIKVDGEEFSGAIIENTATGHKVFYEVDDKTVYWTLWNNNDSVPWVCPEPMSWATNAPNMREKFSDKEVGFATIEAGDKWSMRSWLYAK